MIKVYFESDSVDRGFRKLKKLHKAPYIHLTVDSLKGEAKVLCGVLCQRKDGGWMLNTACEINDVSGLRNIAMDRISKIMFNGKEKNPLEKEVSDAQT